MADGGGAGPDRAKGPDAQGTGSGPWPAHGDAPGRDPWDASWGAPPAADAVADARLRLIATTDLHAHLLPHDYYADRPAAIGLALAARLIRALRAEGEAVGATVILVDNGDLLQGSLLSDWLVEGDNREELAREGLATHPMIAAMNALGFDAGTLGNHEFNYGLPALRRALAGASFPMVAANVRAGEGSLAPPSTILERQVPGPDGRPRPLRVGLLGVAPPQIAVWDRRILGSDVSTRDILEAAREEVPRLRAQGADLVVALCHSGLGHERPEPLMENAAVPLAAIPGLDAVVAGHSHEVFPGGNRAATAAVDPAAGTIHGVPAVQPGAHGSHVGVIDLALRWRGGAEGSPWEVAGARARAILVTPPGTPEAEVAARTDPGLAALAAPLHARLLRAASQPVGETLVPLQSYLALVAAGPALDVVADAQRAYVRRILSGTGVEGLPILAAVAPFRAGGRSGVGNYVDVGPGPIALRQAAGLYVFPNGVAVVEITGAGLRDWLERGASMFRTLVPGLDDQPLIDPAFPSYNFETIDGLDWEVDPTRPPRTDADGRVIDPAASRIRDLRHEGRPVADGDRFALATNSYRLAAGGAFAAAQGARRLHESPRQVRDVVLAHIRAAPVDPAPRRRWRFASLPGTAAWFDTGPGARAHLASAEGRTIEDLGPAPDGFHRLRLWL